MNLKIKIVRRRYKILLWHDKLYAIISDRCLTKQMELVWSDWVLSLSIWNNWPSFRGGNIFISLPHFGISNIKMPNKKFNAQLDTTKSLLARVTSRCNKFLIDKRVNLGVSVDWKSNVNNQMVFHFEMV